MIPYEVNSMKKKADVNAIITELKALYPVGICSLNYEKDYELLFSSWNSPHTVS